MPRYIIERDVGAIDLEALPEIGKVALGAANSLEGVVWIRSYLSEAEGKVYCEYEAPNPDAVHEHARLAGLPVTRISQITLEIEPSMFR